MRLAKDTKLGGEIILAEEACYERHHDYLRCPECGEMVFWVRGTEYQRDNKVIRKPAYFAHHKGDGLECELRVKSYSQERLLSLYSEAKNQRLSILQKHLEMMLLEGFGYAVHLCKKLSMPFHVYSQLTKMHGFTPKIGKNELNELNLAAEIKLKNFDVPGDLACQKSIKITHCRDKCFKLLLELQLSYSYAFDEKKAIKILEAKILNNPVKSDNFYSVSGFKNNWKIAREVLDLLFNSCSMKLVQARFLQALFYGDMYSKILKEKKQNWTQDFINRVFDYAATQVDWLSLLDKYSGSSNEAEINKKYLEKIRNDSMLAKSFETNDVFTIADDRDLETLACPLDVQSCSSLLHSLFKPTRYYLNIDDSYYLYLADSCSEIAEQVKQSINYDIKKFFLKIVPNLPLTQSNWNAVITTHKSILSKFDFTPNKVLQYIVLFEIFRFSVHSDINYDYVFHKGNIGMIPLDELVIRFINVGLIASFLHLAGWGPERISRAVLTICFKEYGILEQMKAPIAI